MRMKALDIVRWLRDVICSIVNVNREGQRLCSQASPTLPVIAECSNGSITNSLATCKELRYTSFHRPPLSSARRCIDHVLLSLKHLVFIELSATRGTGHILQMTGRSYQLFLLVIKSRHQSILVVSNAFGFLLWFRNPRFL